MEVAENKSAGRISAVFAGLLGREVMGIGEFYGKIMYQYKIPLISTDRTGYNKRYSAIFL